MIDNIILVLKMSIIITLIYLLFFIISNVDKIREMYKGLDKTNMTMLDKIILITLIIGEEIGGR